MREELDKITTMLNKKIIETQLEVEAIRESVKHIEAMAAHGFRSISHNIQAMNSSALINGGRLNAMEKIYLENGYTEEDLKNRYQVEIEKIQAAQQELYEKMYKERMAEIKELVSEEEVDLEEIKRTKEIPGLVTSEEE